LETYPRSLRAMGRAILTQNGQLPGASLQERKAEGDTSIELLAAKGNAPSFPYGHR
jgi:hypothetical protein